MRDLLFFLSFAGALGLLFLVTSGPRSAALAVAGSAIGIGSMSLLRRLGQRRP